MSEQVDLAAETVEGAFYRVDPVALRRFRLHSGWTQRRMAEQLDVTQTTVCLWEKGVHIPRVAIQPRIAVLLAAQAAVLPEEGPAQTGQESFPPSGQPVDHRAVLALPVLSTRRGRRRRWEDDFPGHPTCVAEVRPGQWIKVGRHYENLVVARRDLPSGAAPTCAVRVAAPRRAGA